MNNNLETGEILLEFPKDFRPGKQCKVQDDFWKNINKKRKRPPISMMTLEKIHYQRMMKTINKAFYVE